MPELAVSVHNKKKKQEEILLQGENVITPVRSFLKDLTMSTVKGSNWQQHLA